MHAGKLKDAMRFERRAKVKGEAGFKQGDFAPFGEMVFADFDAGSPRAPAEIATRLEGRSPYHVTVWDTPESRAVTSADRIVRVDDGAVFDIQADPVPPPGQDGIFLTFFCVRGGSGG